MYCVAIAFTVVLLVAPAYTATSAAISEVQFKGGSAKATSYHSGNWIPANAFILGHRYGWHNAPREYGRFPTMVWYEFPAGKTFVPARVSFHPRTDCDHCIDQAPTVWQFVGSKDQHCGRWGKWTILCEDKSNTGYPHKYWHKYCDVDDKIVSEFRCLGISVLNNKNKGGAIHLKDVRMWKKTTQ